MCSRKAQITKKLKNLKEKVDTFETQTDEEKLIKEDLNYLEEKKKLLEMEVKTIR